MTCLRGLSEPVVTSKLSGDLLTHLRAASEGHVKLYVVKCLLEEMPEQQYGNLVKSVHMCQNPWITTTQCKPESLTAVMPACTC